MAEIILDQVTKRFPDGALAVDKIDLDIKDGEFMILVGPSGCGKSTTLNMIAGLEDITSGQLRIGDQVVNNMAPKDRDIAMVFQSYALYPHMTVRENMGFALKLAKTPKAVIDEKVNEAARILDLTQHLDRKPANLSGGQRQRVAMGRAIVRSPKAFLMDEPLSNLDAKLRVQMRTEVSRIQRRLGTTMVYVTHDQTEAMTLGDRVAVMRLGLLQQVASPQELYDSPANLFVAGFIGSPAMNFMAVTLEEGRLRTALGEIPLTGQLRQTLERSGAGREVIVGIRPEDFEDAALVPANERGNGITFNATIDVVESLGAEKYVYFTRDLGKAVNVAELEELAKDSGRADTGSTAETVVARLSPETRITEGQNAVLWVDVRKLHVFDPATGHNLTRGAVGAPGGSAAPAGPDTSAQAATTQTATGDWTTAAADARQADTAAAGAGEAGSAAATGDAGTVAADTREAGTAATGTREAGTAATDTAAADATEAGTAAADTGDADSR
jgi:multiple sugar transport system ATP-binding protein